MRGSMIKIEVMLRYNDYIHYHTIQFDNMHEECVPCYNIMY